MNTVNRSNSLSILLYNASLILLKIKFRHKKEIIRNFFYIQLDQMKIQMATYLFDCVCINGASPFFVMWVKVATHLITTTLQITKGSCRLRPSGASLGPGEHFLSTGISRKQKYSSIQCMMLSTHILYCGTIMFMFKWKNVHFGHWLLSMQNTSTKDIIILWQAKCNQGTLPTKCDKIFYSSWSSILNRMVRIQFTASIDYQFSFQRLF